jgi:hypothetical protein
VFRAALTGGALFSIEDLHFYDLRHEAASRRLERDFTIARVAFVSKHRSSRSLRRYTGRQVEKKL